MKDKKKPNNSFDIVQLYYPNEWRKNVSEFLPGEEPEHFDWFICSHRIFDDDNKMYYSSISPDSQFYCSATGKTLTSQKQGKISKRGKNSSSKNSSSKNSSSSKSKLLILSDSHNKKMLCKHFGYMCGCDSDRDVLSTECELTTKSDALIKGAKKAVKLGYDGVVIQHECLESELDVSDAILCQNATFVFKKGILAQTDSLHPNRCGIVKYSKKHNSCIRDVIPKFPTHKEIDELLQDNDCSVISATLYDIIKMYMKRR